MSPGDKRRWNTLEHRKAKDARERLQHERDHLRARLIELVARGTGPAVRIEIQNTKARLQAINSDYHQAAAREHLLAHELQVGV